MANNYMQFSFVVEDVTKEQSEWIEAVHGACVLADETGDEPEGPFADVARRCLGASLQTGVQVERENGHLILYAEESGDVEYTANLLQEYLRAFDLDRAIGFSWSETCSKMRPDEFAGGAAFVTKDNVEFQTTREWIHGKMQAWSDKA